MSAKHEKPKRNKSEVCLQCEQLYSWAQLKNHPQKFQG